MDASVIVPVRDGAAHLPALFDALAAQRRAPREVIVVDDGSHDASRALAERAEVVDRVLLSAGRGPGAARNAGAAAATGEVLAFTDADCAPARGWLEAGLEAMAGADLVQGAVAPPPGETAGALDRTVVVERAGGLFETANLMIRRDLFARLGGFEPWLSPRRGKELGEDVWLGWRARRAGARVAYAPGAVVHHAVERRGAAAYVAERARLRFFPQIVARIPELREEALYGRVFLTRRSAAFDAALAGALLARGGRWAALAAGAPYARLVAADARSAGPGVAAARAAADAVGLAALALGSARARAVVL